MARDYPDSDTVSAVGIHIERSDTGFSSLRSRILFEPLIPAQGNGDSGSFGDGVLIQWRAGAMPKGVVMAALAIRQDYEPADLRRRAAREGDRGLCGCWPSPMRWRACPGPKRPGWPGWSARRCAMRCCASTLRDLRASTTSLARVAPSG